MTLEVVRYTYKPLFVDAVRVTKDNMEEIAAWCQGTIEGSADRPYVKVNAIRAVRFRETQAFVGDWVLKSDVGFKIYMHKAFQHNFILAPEESDPKAVELLENIFAARNEKEDAA